MEPSKIAVRARFRAALTITGKPVISQECEISPTAPGEVGGCASVGTRRASAVFSGPWRPDASSHARSTSREGTDGGGARHTHRSSAKPRIEPPRLPKVVPLCDRPAAWTAHRVRRCRSACQRAAFAVAGSLRRAMRASRPLSEDRSRLDLDHPAKVTCVYEDPRQTLYSPVVLSSIVDSLTL